jgi:hypothetical protein
MLRELNFVDSVLLITVFDLAAVRGKFSCKNTPKSTARPELGRTHPLDAINPISEYKGTRTRGDAVRAMAPAPSPIYRLYLYILSYLGKINVRIKLYGLNLPTLPEQCSKW